MEKLKAFGRAVDSLLTGVGQLIQLAIVAVIGGAIAIYGIAAFEYTAYAVALIILASTPIILFIGLVMEGWWRIEESDSSLVFPILEQPFGR